MAAKEAKIAEKAAAKEAKIAESDKVKAAKIAADFVAENKEPELEEEAMEEGGIEETNVNKFVFEGKTYLRDEEDILYDPETEEEVGYFDEENQCIGDIVMEDDDENDEGSDIEM